MFAHPLTSFCTHLEASSCHIEKCDRASHPRTRSASNFPAPCFFLVSCFCLGARAWRAALGNSALSARALTLFITTVVFVRTVFDAFRLGSPLEYILMLLWVGFTKLPAFDAFWTGVDNSIHFGLHPCGGKPQNLILMGFQYHRNKLSSTSTQ